VTLWQSIVLWTGVVMELAGIALAVLDTLDVRRAFRQRFGRAHIRAAAELLAIGDAAHADTGRTPTVEERLAGLEHGLAEVRNDIPRQVAAAREALEGEIRSEAASIRADLDFQVKDLRRLLGVGVEPNRRRAWGFALFAAGLLLQTVANYVR
jgi:hypothetical protein